MKDTRALHCGSAYMQARELTHGLPGRRYLVSYLILTYWEGAGGGV